MNVPIDRIAMALLLTACLALVGKNWLREHPGDNPWALLELDERPGWATGRKLASLRSDPAACRAFLTRSGLPNDDLPPIGAGVCQRPDRRILSISAISLSPRRAEATCGVDAALAWWMRHGVQPQARAMFHSRVVRIEHLGTVNCRRIAKRGGGEGAWSEHATGNAIDISAFVLANGRRIEIRRDWKGGVDDAAFLHAVRDEACVSFATVLSPDYNAAHADHLHLDQANRPGGWKACR